MNNKGVLPTTTAVAITVEEFTDIIQSASFITAAIGAGVSTEVGLKV